MTELTRDGILALRDGATPGIHSVIIAPDDFRSIADTAIAALDREAKANVRVEILEETIARLQGPLSVATLVATMEAAEAERDALRAQLTTARAETWEAAAKVASGYTPREFNTRYSVKWASSRMSILAAQKHGDMCVSITAEDIAAALRAMAKEAGE